MVGDTRKVHAFGGEGFGGGEVLRVIHRRRMQIGGVRSALLPEKHLGGDRCPRKTQDSRVYRARAAQRNQLLYSLKGM
jgi:hypothetical protein